MPWFLRQAWTPKEIDLKPTSLEARLALLESAAGQSLECLGRPQSRSSPRLRGLRSSNSFMTEGPWSPCNNTTQGRLTELDAEDVLGQSQMLTGFHPANMSLRERALVCMSCSSQR